MFDSVFVNAIAVFGASFLMSLTSTLLNRKFVDRENFVKWQEETKRWKAEKERAEKAGDKKLLTKLKRQEKRINQIGSKMMKGQMLSMISNMAILFTVWQLLLMYFADKIIAYLPFSIPFVTEAPPFPMPFFVWYLLCSFLANAILQRIFGTSMGMGLQPQTAE